MQIYRDLDLAAVEKRRRIESAYYQNITHPLAKLAAAKTDKNGAPIRENFVKLQVCMSACVGAHECAVGLPFLGVIICTHITTRTRIHTCMRTYIRLSIHKRKHTNGSSIARVKHTHE